MPGRHERRDGERALKQGTYLGLTEFSRRTIAFFDAFPVSGGHMLVIPRRQVFDTGMRSRGSSQLVQKPRASFAPNFSGIPSGAEGLHEPASCVDKGV
jgi:hypothetical protein